MSVNKCSWCSTNETPMWRKGPQEVVLCNACGIKYLNQRRKTKGGDQGHSSSSFEPKPTVAAVSSTTKKSNPIGSVKRILEAKYPRPKRSTSAFLRFCHHNRMSFTQQNPSLQFGQVSKILSETWKLLKPEAKKHYEEQAILDKERYRREKRAYDDQMARYFNEMDSNTMTKEKTANLRKALQGYRAEFRSRPKVTRVAFKAPIQLYQTRQRHYQRTASAETFRSVTPKRPMPSRSSPRAAFNGPHSADALAWSSRTAREEIVDTQPYVSSIPLQPVAGYISSSSSTDLVHRTMSSPKPLSPWHPSAVQQQSRNHAEEVGLPPLKTVMNYLDQFKLNAM